MALQKTISLITNFDTEVKFNDAYIRVDNINAKKGFSRAFVFLHKEKNGQVLQKKNYVFDYDINGENPIKQAYLHLKTLPEFADAVDC